MKMTIRVRGKGKTAELMLAPYSPAKKRCVPKVVGKIVLERQLFDHLPRVSADLGEMLTTEDRKAVDSWLEKHNAGIVVQEEEIAANSAVTILKRTIAGLRKRKISKERTELLLALADELKSVLVEKAGHPAPKKKPRARKSAPKSAEGA